MASFRSRSLAARRRLGEALESRNMLSGISLLSVTGDGGSSLKFRYELPTESAAFDVSFYRSTDAIFGRDTLLDVVSISNPADLSAGIHEKTLALGTGAGEVALPGAGATEPTTNYLILAAANAATIAQGTNARTNTQDGLAAFSGMYHMAGGQYMVHGSEALDTVHVLAGEVTMNGVSRSYSASAVTGFRVRLHEGDDFLTGGAATKTILALGGAGNDFLTGGTAVDTLNGDAGLDTLIGGRGNDKLDGGADADRYLIVGTIDGTDAIKDRGTTGVDELAAGADGARILLPATFSAVLTGLESVSGAGFTGVVVQGTAAANNYDFSQMTMPGIAKIDAAAGADVVTGSTSDDVIAATVGDDFVAGMAGRDTYVFAGNRSGYLLAEAGGVITATDTLPTTHGNDGTDTLQLIEVLQFLDMSLDLAANTAPTATDDTLTVGEDDANSHTIAFLANDTDPDLASGDDMTLVSVDSTGVLGSVSLSADRRSLVYSQSALFEHLKPGESVTETITYTIKDLAGHTATGTMTVTISGANDAPVAVNDSITVSEDAAPFDILALANDTDPDVNDTRRIVSINGSAVLGLVEIAETPTKAVYTLGLAHQNLRAGQTATETFTYVIADESGATSTGTVTVTIEGADDGFRAMPNGERTTEGTPVSIDILANDINDINPGDIQLLNIDTVGVPPSVHLIIIYGVGVGRFNPGFPATKGRVDLAADGRTAIYTPHDSLGAGESGIDFFRYTIKDSTTRRSLAIVSVTVIGVNDVPVAAHDTATVPWNAAPFTMNVVANDSDVDATDAIRLVSVNSAGLQGSVSLSEDGKNVVYSVGNAFADLPHGQTATETFTYVIADKSGAQTTGTATVTVTGANHAPVAGDDTATLGEDGAAVGISFLDNDSDADIPHGDAISLVSVDDSSLLGSVTVAEDGQSFTYSHDDAFQSLRQDQTATEELTYTIRDHLGLTSTANVSITVVGANDAPTAVTDTKTVDEDESSVSISVLANDTDPDANDTRRVSAVNGTGLRGSVSIASGGSGVVYNPGSAFQYLRSGQTATETFTYTMVDSQGASSNATVTVTVTGTNEQPVFVQPPSPPSGSMVGTANDDVLIGGAGVDTIYGQGGDDEIFGNGGADRIFGGIGTDDIDGGAGNDILHGGSDRDDLTGDVGADIFRFYLVSDSTVTNFDRVRDFSAEEGDKIDLSLIDADYYDLAGNNAFSLAASLTGQSGQLVVQHVVEDIWTILGDVTGDGVADLKIEVHYDGILTASDFLL